MADPHGSISGTTGMLSRRCICVMALSNTACLSARRAASVSTRATSAGRPAKLAMNGTATTLLPLGDNRMVNP